MIKSGNKKSRIMAILTSEKTGIISLLVVAIIFPLAMFIHSCNQTALIVPGKKLEKTLKNMSNEALSIRKTNKEVTSVTGFKCQKRSNFLEARHHCTANVHFTDGTMSQICILRDFYHPIIGYRLETHCVNMTVSMCELDSDIVIKKDFCFKTLFYDFHNEVVQ